MDLEKLQMTRPPQPELWGGFECTIARVGDEYRDQCQETGHSQRSGDLDAALGLGLKRLRHPVLWEQVAPDGLESLHWSWVDDRLQALRGHGVGVIAGLLHHGSGPRYTSLLDPNFPGLLARYAAAFAERYPWLEDYTPVNEPLTTARFSGLYGHWYPHRRDSTVFLQMLMTECRAIAAAMKAVRRINPYARLIQTEDLGKVFSTSRLTYQAQYENERRWLSFDLLTGRVDRTHSWYERFVRSGVSERHLAELVEEPCAPDVVGINHYLTSDRYLDDDIAGYPPEHVGGNGRDRYADVAAARVPIPCRKLGVGPRLAEAWERYRIPVAVTEVHNGSTREEQLRWLLQAWNDVRRLQARGVEVRAFTIWALAGAVDWTSLLTQRRDLYEPGVFDARSHPPRPTALAFAVRALAEGRHYWHPVTTAPGWWRRPNRFHRPAAGPAVKRVARCRPILIAGPGMLSRAFASICEDRGLAHGPLTAETNAAGYGHIRRAIRRSRPWAIIIAGSPARLSMRGGHTAEELGALTEIAQEERLSLVAFSSDLVFDGQIERPYVESDPTCPACTYGRHSAGLEQRVLERHERAMVVRTAALFGPDCRHFAQAVVDALRCKKTIRLSRRRLISPTFVPDLVHTVLDLLIDEVSGIWHVANGGRMSWHAFAQRIAGAAGLDPSLVRDLGSGAGRNTALTSERGVRLPPVEEAIARYCSMLRAA